jgi:hypothetical protein
LRFTEKNLSSHLIKIFLCKIKWESEVLGAVVPKDKTEFIYQGDSEISLFLKVNKMWGSR